MNSNRALGTGISLAAVFGALTATPAAVAWPTCSHPGVNGSTSGYQSAVYRTTPAPLASEPGFSTGSTHNEGHREGNGRGSLESKGNGDQGKRLSDGLVLPGQPRWRM